MIKIFALLSIGFLICSGVRAPEVSTHSRGVCFSGEVIENVASDLTPEFRKSTSNPVLNHSGFTVSTHPFDFPEALPLSALLVTKLQTFSDQPFLQSNDLFPHDRPPKVFSV